jgi:excinuclease UvrABC nuclease subunit
MVAAVARIEAVVCGSRHEAAWLERNLLEVDLPPWNRTPGGQEVEVAIALDASVRAPALRAVHLPQPPDEGVTLFGPYLGGLQVRRAVSGLLRVYPLSYTAASLRGAEQDLADWMAVGRGDRAVMVRSLTAVLNRDATAVALAGAALAEARGRAARQEAFELAARIHDELRGLEWVSSAQRVSLLSQESADICGYAEGILVGFALRSGRLRRWIARRCDVRDAGPHLEATPEAWRDLARNNAELAAALERAGSAGPSPHIRSR